MTREEKIKSMNIPEMAKLLWALDSGTLHIPILYSCDILTMFDCAEKNCYKCYENYLKGQYNNDD